MPTRILIEPEDEAQLYIVIPTAIDQLRSLGVRVTAGALIHDVDRRFGVVLLKNPTEKHKALHILSKAGIKARAAMPV